MMPSSQVYRLGSEADTVVLGSLLARVLRPGMLVFLEGELGAGKTSLCRGIINGLGHEGAVKSPTYTLVEPYDATRIPVYHFDLYRLSEPVELEEMGFRDYVAGEHLCLLEWPQRGQGFLPPADLAITIQHEGQGRLVELEAFSTGARESLAELGNSLPGAVT